MKKKRWRALLASLLAAALVAGAPATYAQEPAATEAQGGAQTEEAPGILSASAQDAATELQTEYLEGLSEEIPEELSEGLPEEMPGEITEEITEGLSEALPEDAPVQELAPEVAEGQADTGAPPAGQPQPGTEGLLEAGAEPGAEPQTEPVPGEDINAELVLGDETEADAMADMDAPETNIDPADGVTLEGAGGTCGDSPYVVCEWTDGETLKDLTADYTFTKVGKELRGWYTAQNGGHKREDSYQPQKGEVLYAHWDTDAAHPDILCSTDPNAPFEIENLAQLNSLRVLTNEVGTVSKVDRDRQYLLVADIELPADWEPIGCRNPNPGSGPFGKGDCTFTGTFDGNGHTITVARGGKSLFGLVRECVIKNLKIYGEYINGAGLITNDFNIDYGPSGDYWKDVRKTAVIEKVTVITGTHTTSGGIMDGSGSGKNNVEIKDCVVQPGVHTVGGGIIQSLNGSIINCESYADVTSTRSAGGLTAGKGQSMGDFIIKNCYVAGTVSGGSDGYVGGLAGCGYIAIDAPNSPGVMIEDNICVATVSGGQYTGGILGCEYVKEPYTNGPSWLKGNYFAGSITDGGQYTGGVVGYYRPYNKNTHNGTNYALDTCGAAKAYGDWGDPDLSDQANRLRATFDPDEAFQLASAAQVASGEVAWGLNQRPGSASDIWSQSGEGRPVRNAGIATYRASLFQSWDEGGTVSLTGFTSSNVAAYQNKGGTVTVQAVPAEGCTVGRILMVDADGEHDITASGSFEMQAQDVTVLVSFGDASGRYVQDIRIGSMPQKTEYYPGEAFDPAGLTVVARYNGDIEETVPVTADMVLGFDSRTLGTKNLTVAYRGAVAALQVRVVQRQKGKIHVKFTLLGDDPHGDTQAPHTLNAGNLQEWIPQTELELDEGALVVDAFAATLLAGGYSWNNAGVENGMDGNYIVGITPPGGAELEEFSNGPNSGWMFTLNGEHVLFGVAQQELEDGDNIVFHYSDDYTLENSNLSGDPNPEQTEPTEEPKPGGDTPSTEGTGNDAAPVQMPESDTPVAENPAQNMESEKNQPEIGDTAAVSGSDYKISSGTAVAYQKAPGSKKKVTVPAKVKIDGKYYKVTSIEAGAFKGNKKVTAITVGKNVTSIGKKAFKGCKKLKTITIASTKLKAKDIANGAFKGVPKGTVIKVPKSKLKAYTKLFRQKGLSKSVKIKKR